MSRKEDFFVLACIAAQTVNVPWTPAFEALIKYGLQSRDLSAFTKFGKLSLTTISIPDFGLKL